jgi:plastocyanin
MAILAERRDAIRAPFPPFPFAAPHHSLSPEATLRRIFALLLVTPLLANCSESVTPMAPAGPAHTLEESSLNGWTESSLDAWTLEDWTLGESTPAESPLQVAPGSGALMEFGNPQAGTPYPPQVHDQSLHGKDRVIPGTVVIDAGQKVTFRVYSGHRVAIYKSGTRPEDITVGPGPFVLDPTNRMALQAAPVPSLSWTFAQPGRYLVICAITRHFVVAKMYGWVIVR